MIVITISCPGVSARTFLITYMYKIFTALLLGLFICFAAKAQQTAVKKSDTTAYYMTDSGNLAYDEQDADFIRFIYKALPGEDTAMVNITDYYRDGKTKLVARSYNDQMKFESGVQGYCLEFYNNGHKKSVRNYNRGKLTGDAMEYYPNGKIYNIKNYDTGSVFLKDCLDSTGKVLAENGNGKWIWYGDNFRRFEEGPIVNGRENGKWKGIGSDSSSYSYTYNNGLIITKKEYASYGKKIFTEVDINPRLKGGDRAFKSYLGRTIKYPAYAREHYIRGIVMLSFIVERDGRLTHINVIENLGGGLDEEALRLMKECPVWEPGMINGIPVRVLVRMPMNFSF